MAVVVESGNQEFYRFFQVILQVGRKQAESEADFCPMHDATAYPIKPR